jgi:sugar phosphate isomerase/epimerase
MKKQETISRRDFMHQSVVLSTSLITLPGFKSITPVNYKMGLQLFSVRAPMSKDVVDTVKKISSIGYEDCETYGYDPAAGTYYGLKASAFRQLLADHQMITTSGHYDFNKFFDQPADALMRYTDQCIDGARALGQRYITWPWLAPEFRSLENFMVLTGKLNAIGERVNKAGLGFA